MNHRIKSNMRQQMTGNYSDGSVSKKSGFVPTPEQRWAYMRKSSEGGRMFCDRCKYAFSANYVKPVVRNLRTIYLCEKCRGK